MLFTHITQFVDAHQLLHSQQKIVIGFSGGPDSMLLLNYLKLREQELSLTIIAAHLDHGWRTESAQERHFCQQYCEQLEVTCVAAQLSELNIIIKNTGSKEEYGRLVRRAFFQQVKELYQADSIALAHHLDDQLETFFIRLIRGSTVAGLASMRPQHHEYIRPLLNIRKQDILDYLQKNQIAYLTDPTNTSPDFLRNRIRLDLLPILEKIDQRFVGNTQRSIVSLQQTDAFLEKLARQTLTDITTDSVTSELSLTKLKALDPYLKNLVISQWLYQAQVPITMSASLLDEINRFLSNTKNTTHQFNQWALVKKQQKIFLIMLE